MKRRDRMALWLAKRVLRLASADYRAQIQHMRITDQRGSFDVLTAAAGVLSGDSA